MKISYQSPSCQDGLRTAKAFRTKKEKIKYYLSLSVILGLGLVAAYGLLTYNNPVEIGSASFLPVVRRRLNSIIAMAIAALCQSVATLSFQTITGNKIITPSLLGFESVYSVINTGLMFFFGLSAFLSFQGRGLFIIQIILMVLVSLVLYGSLLTGKHGNLQLMLLVGVVMGTGLKTLAVFMRRLLAPSEFDILQAKLFASVNHADPEFFPIAIPIVILVSLIVVSKSNKLNALGLGREVSISIGLDHKREVISVLVLVAILMSISTALVGPMTFFGFLVVALTYQISQTYDHKYLYPMAIGLGFLILSLAYFIMNHIFSAQGVVSIIIEMFGGLVFLAFVLKRGSL